MTCAPWSKWVGLYNTDATSPGPEKIALSSKHLLWLRRWPALSLYLNSGLVSRPVPLVVLDFEDSLSIEQIIRMI